MRNAIGNLYRTGREIRQITQAEMAKKAGVSRQLISAMESGRLIPSHELLKKLALLYGIKLEEVEKTLNTFQEERALIELAKLSQTDWLPLIKAISGSNLQRCTLRDFAILANLQSELGRQLTSETISSLFEEKQS